MTPFAQQVSRLAEAIWSARYPAAPALQESGVERDRFSRVARGVIAELSNPHDYPIEESWP